MKNITSVVLILLLSLSIIFSAPVVLFLFNTNAQSISTIFASIPASLLNFNLIPDAHAACPNPPCIAPKPTTLTLNPIADTPFCNTVTATGKLVYSGGSGAGVDGEVITFSSDNGGSVPSPVDTGAGGTFSVSFTAPCSVSSGWHLQAHFVGDSDINARTSDSTIQSYNTIKHSTLLSIAIEHQSSSSSDIPWGTIATATGVLTDNSGIPIASEPITFTSPNGSPIPASVVTRADQDGFISYRANFTTSNSITTGWQLQAHFAGDSNYLATNSPIQSYNTVKRATFLLLANPGDTPWGTTGNVGGELDDITSCSSSCIGPASKTITFTTSNGSPLPSPVITHSDGGYTGIFRASNTVFNGWNIQAHFAGDSLYLASNSGVEGYNTVKHTTHLALQSVVPNTPWSRPTSLPVILTDTSLPAGTALSGKTIHFTGTGVINMADKTTDSTGKATGTGTSPSTVATGWTYQAHFAGDSLYSAVNTLVHTYNTLKHTSSMTLVISPTSIRPGGAYSVSGTLTDTTKSVGLASKTITFTATSPITISSKTTNSLGQYSATGLIAPSTTGTYSIQSHYAGESLYNAANSPTQTLTVSTTAAAAITGPTHSKVAAPAANTSSTTILSQSAPSLSLTPHYSTNTNTNSNHTAQSASPKLPLRSSPSLSSLTSPSQLQSPSPPLTLGSSNNNNNSTLKNPVSPSSYSSSTSLLFQKRQQQQQQQQYPYQYPYPYQNQYHSTYPQPSSPSSSPYYKSQKPSGIQHINQPPIANAGVSQTVYGGTTVVLDGRASYDPDNYAIGINSYGSRIMTNNGISAYQWTQVQIPTNTAVQNPIVMLQGPNTATPAFVAPILPSDTMLAFSLKVIDSDGGAASSNPSIVYVMVKHNPNNIGTTGGNTPGTTILQPQHQQPQQPIVPNNNAMPPQPNSVPSTSLSQLGSSNTQNTVPPGVP